MQMSRASRKLGVAVVGVGGAVATTAAAGVEMLKRGGNRLDGLPLAGVSVQGLAQYQDLVFGGWGPNGAHPAPAGAPHRVLNDNQPDEGFPAPSRLRPWAAVGSGGLCRHV